MNTQPTEQGALPQLCAATAEASDPSVGKELWEASERLTHVNYLDA